MGVDGIILNAAAGGGAALRRFQAVRESELGRKLGLQQSHVFDGRDTGGATGVSLGRGLRDWLASEIRAGGRRFVVAGGDGTVNLALSAFLELRATDSIPTEVAFGAIGIGSSNDFQKPFGATGRERIGDRPCRLDFARAFPHDIGTLTLEARGTPDRYFFINASLGVTAEANDRFNRGGAGFQKLKSAWVDGAILTAALSTFATYRNRQVHLSVEGGFEGDVALTNLGVIKNRFFSGSFHYDDGPAADDGLLGVRVCRDMGRAEMLATLNAMSKGKFNGRAKTYSAASHAVTVEARAGETLAIETDGEVVRASRVALGVRSREVLLCP